MSRNVILDLAVTLDGFIEGPNGEIDWCIMDDDMDFASFLTSVDTIFFGRISYDQWSVYQPDESAGVMEYAHWNSIQKKKKYVFSRQNRQDKNATFILSDIANRVAEIKNQKGKDIWLFGGASLIRTFIQLNLIDQYRLSIHPVLLGSGKPLFDELNERVNLKWIKNQYLQVGGSTSDL